MTESGDAENAGLTAKCSKILEVLEEGRKTAGEIAGSVEVKEEVAEKPASGDQLSNLRRLVNSIAWGVGGLADQLNRIQNQL